VAKTNVFFIELPTSNKLKFVCDVTELFYNQHHSLVIYAHDPKSVTQIDQLLWTWKQDSFIPHSRSAQQDTTPVTIYASGEDLADTDVLIQFDPIQPDELSRFRYVIDFAELYDKNRLSDSRRRFKELRNSDNYEIEFLKLGAFLNKKF